MNDNLANSSTEWSAWLGLVWTRGRGLRAILLDKWTLCHNGGRRYELIMTKLSEFFDGVLKGARNMPRLPMSR